MSFNFSFRDTKIGLISSNPDATLGLIKLDLEADAGVKKESINFRDMSIYIASTSDARLGEDVIADMKDDIPPKNKKDVK